MRGLAIRTDHHYRRGQIGLAHGPTAAGCPDARRGRARWRITAVNSRRPHGRGPTAAGCSSGEPRSLRGTSGGTAALSIAAARARSRLMPRELSIRMATGRRTARRRSRVEVRVRRIRPGVHTTSAATRGRASAFGGSDTGSASAGNRARGPPPAGQGRGSRGPMTAARWSASARGRGRGFAPVRGVVPRG
jgi:hypothetical protein